MKLTTTSQFDKKDIEATQAYKDLQLFIDYQIQFNQNVERILRNKTSILDNLDMRTVQINLDNNVEQEIAETRKVIGVIPISSSVAITSFLWRITQSGAIAVKASLASRSNVTLLIMY